MRVDTTNNYTDTDVGRPSVRITTKKAYTKGLFIADIAHMPSNACGSWPAFWSLGSGTWPANGEVDIIEGVNNQPTNIFAMHTSDGCTISGTDQTSTLLTEDCSTTGKYGYTGCTSQMPSGSSFGTSFNKANGGVYAMEWTSQAIKLWFFPRNEIPDSIAAGAPDVSEFGKPSANFQGSCDIDKHFKDHSFVFDTTFCGDWAGNVYGSSGCPMYNNADGTSKGPIYSCVEYVGKNPKAFKDTYWKINSFQVFQITNPTMTTTTISTSSLPSSIPAVSTSAISLTTIDIAQGASTTITGFTNFATTNSISTSVSTSAASSSSHATSSSASSVSHATSSSASSSSHATSSSASSVSHATSSSVSVVTQATSSSVSSASHAGSSSASSASSSVATGAASSTHGTASSSGVSGTGSASSTGSAAYPSGSNSQTLVTVTLSSTFTVVHTTPCTTSTEDASVSKDSYGSPSAPHNTVSSSSSPSSLSSPSSPSSPSSSASTVVDAQQPSSSPCSTSSSSQTAAAYESTETPTTTDTYVSTEDSYPTGYPSESPSTTVEAHASTKTPCTTSTEVSKEGSHPTGGPGKPYSAPSSSPVKNYNNPPPASSIVFEVYEPSGSPSSIVVYVPETVKAADHPSSVPTHGAYHPGGKPPSKAGESIASKPSQAPAHYPIESYPSGGHENGGYSSPNNEKNNNNNYPAAPSAPSPKSSQAPHAGPGYGGNTVTSYVTTVKVIQTKTAIVTAVPAETYTPVRYGSGNVTYTATGTAKISSKPSAVTSQPAGYTGAAVKNAVGWGVAAFVALMGAALV